MASLGEPTHASDDHFDGAVAQERKQSEGRTKKWTMRPRYPGQATFDLANDMRQLPFSKSPYKTPQIEFMGIEGSPVGLFCESCGVTIQTCSCDPLMKELNGMQEKAREERFTSSSPPVSPRFDNIFLEPATRPITQEQLIAEVKGVYSGLVMVEQRCIEIDQGLASRNSKISNEQWRALIALHRTLLHEHYDFFLATQHPLACPRPCVAVR